MTSLYVDQMELFLKDQNTIELGVVFKEQLSHTFETSSVE